ncbi:MAG: hypothetical protein K9L78_03620 [Victivallales bacterium]|nr:hypothetical protein [Victivallales bacterium]MCF7889189.1 hypothetical protein [Victivallales bacterium]
MFFFELNWKKLQILCIFYASFVCIFSTQADRINTDTGKTASAGSAFSVSDTERTSSDRLYSVLLNNLKNNRTQLKITENLQALVPDGYEEDHICKINSSLLDAVYLNRKEGNILLDKIIRCCNYLNNKIHNIAIPDDEKLKIECRIDELKNAAEQYGIHINSITSVKKNTSCRILEINDKLRVLILPLGLYDGIRAGRKLVIPNADNARATVISVKQFISAAAVTKGEFKKLSPGMLVEF